MAAPDLQRNGFTVSWKSVKPCLGFFTHYTILGGGTHALHGFASPPPPPPPSASPYLNFRGLVLNFINKKFLLLFLFSVADFFSRTKSFIDIDKGLKNFELVTTLFNLNIELLALKIYFIRTVFNLNFVFVEKSLLKYWGNPKLVTETKKER